MNVCLREGSIPEDWRRGLIVPIWKRNGDVQDLEKYKGIMLLRHVMKVLERILDRKIRKTGDGDRRRAARVLKG